MVRNRIAVAAFFFVNGFLYAGWTARLPELQKHFMISNGLLGTLLFTLAAGALIAMPFAGGLITKMGGHRTTQLTGILFCCLIPLIPVGQNLILTGVIFCMLGLMSGAMDVAMNGQAVYVERLWRKPIMSSFHAVFSIGMASGAGMGSLLSKYKWTLQSHFILVALVGGLILVWASYYLINDSPLASEKKDAKKANHFMLPAKAILPLGIIAFCSMTGEGSMADWSAMYTNKVVGLDMDWSASALAVFATAMTLGRIFGDYFTEKLGREKLLIYNATLATVGLGVALIFASAWATFAGFFLVGLGLSTVVPLVYSAAGNTKGVNPSVGIAMATTIGYAGFFVGPPTIGYLADGWGLRIGLCFTFFLFLVMLFLVSKKYNK